MVSATSSAVVLVVPGAVETIRIVAEFTAIVRAVMLKRAGTGSQLERAGGAGGPLWRGGAAGPKERLKAAMLLQHGGHSCLQITGDGGRTRGATALVHQLVGRLPGFQGRAAFVDDIEAEVFSEHGGVQPVEIADCEPIQILGQDTGAHIQLRGIVFPRCCTSCKVRTLSGKRISAEISNTLRRAQEIVIVAIGEGTLVIPGVSRRVKVYALEGTIEARYKGSIVTLGCITLVRVIATSIFTRRAVAATTAPTTVA